MISANLSDNSVTGDSSVTISVTDNHRISSDVIANGVVVIQGSPSSSINVPLVPGANEIRVMSLDQFSNSSDQTFHFTRDNQGPVISANLSDGQTVSAPQMTFNVTDLVTFTSTVVLNGIDVLTSDQPTFQISLSQGLNSILVSSTDIFGNVSSSNYQIRLDDQAPVIAMSVSNGQVTQSSSVTVSVSDASQFNTIVSINGAPLLSSDLSTFSFLLREGMNDVQVVSTDALGNQSRASAQIRLDTILPTITGAIPSIYQFQSNPGAILVSLSVDETSTILLNGVPIGQFAGPFFVSLPVSGSGLNSWTIKAVDLAGNERSNTLSTNVIIDGSAPVITVNVADNLTVTNPTQGLVINISDQSSVVTSVRVNGSQITQTGSKAFSINAVLPNQGENTIDILSLDAVGNQTTLTRKIFLDSVAPQLLTFSPANGSSLNQVAFAVSGTASEALASAKINNVNLSLSADKKSMSGQINVGSQGTTTLTIVLQDLAGSPCLSNQEVHGRTDIANHSTERCATSFSMVKSSTHC